MSELGPVEGPECCILEICCGGEEQVEALAMKIVAGTSLPKPKAMEVAQWVIAHYDLAPYGSLVDLKRNIAALARAYPPNPGY